MFNLQLNPKSSTLNPIIGLSTTSERLSTYTLLLQTHRQISRTGNGYPLPGEHWLTDRRADRCNQIYNLPALLKLHSAPTLSHFCSALFDQFSTCKQSVNSTPAIWMYKCRTYVMRHAKRSLMAWVVVSPNSRAPTLLLVWLRDLFCMTLPICTMWWSPEIDSPEGTKFCCFYWVVLIKHYLTNNGQQCQCVDGK